MQFRVTANRVNLYTKLLLTMKRVDTNDTKCGTTYQLLMYSYFSLDEH